MGLKFNLRNGTFVLLLVRSEGGIRKCSGPTLSWLHPDQCLQGVNAYLLEWGHSVLSVSFLALLLLLTLSCTWGEKQKDTIVVTKPRVKVQERLEVPWGPQFVFSCRIGYLLACCLNIFIRSHMHW